MSDKKHKIHEQLAHLAIGVYEINPDPANAKFHPPEQITELGKSLQEFGQFRPVVVQQQGMIVRAGNGLLLAARSIFWTHIAALVVDQSDVEAVRLALADNKLAESLWNKEALAKMSLLAGTQVPGFSDAEMSALARALETPTQLKKVEIKKPPAMAWILIGVPTLRYGEIAEHIEKISSVPGIFLDPKWKASAHFQKGRKHPKWKGNRSARTRAMRRYRYRRWRKAVYERDDYTCQKCGKRGGRLHAHHIKSWADFPRLRYVVSNGRTYCIGCHGEIHASCKNGQ